jgi:outer membrane protein assembly factor BamB
MMALASGLAVGGSGCGWITGYLRGSDNTTPPAELLPIDNPISITELWDAEIGSGTEGANVNLAPAVDENRVYAAGRDGEVVALDAATGQAIWQVETELPISAGVGLGEDLAVVGTSDGEVLALRADDGTEVWRVRVSSEVLAVPRIAGETVVVRSIDGTLAALDAGTGSQLWLYTHRVPALTLRGVASPEIVQDLVIAGLDTGKLVVLSLENGGPVFEKTIAPPRGRTEMERLVDIDTAPRVVGDILYVAAYQGNITAMDMRSGRTVWSLDFSSHSGLDVDASRVYVADDTDTLWALDRNSGAVIWKQEGLTGRRLSAPVVSGNYVVVGDFEGYLHWLARDTGRLAGRVRVDKKGIAVAPAVRGDVLFVLGEGGELSAYQAGG